VRRSPGEGHGDLQRRVGRRFRRDPDPGRCRIAGARDPGLRAEDDARRAAADGGVDTLRLIAKGGPYPFSKDGVTFSNREGLLPQHQDGWYHEYTVITPGSSDRGARRIIAGGDGGRFYSDDHYASFREVLSGVSS